MSGTEVSGDAQVEVSDDLDAFSSDFFGQKSVETPPTKGEVEQEDEAPETEVQTDEEDETELKQEIPQKKKTVQDRIDEVVKQREDAKREGAAALEALRKEFEQKLAELKPAAAPAVEANEPQHDDLKADGTEKYPLGEFDPQYIRDLTRYTLEAERVKAEQKAEERFKQQEQINARQAVQAGWNTKLEAATTEYPDLIEKGTALIGQFSNLEPNYSQYLTDVLMGMDHGPEVLYYLSSNPEEAVKIVNSGAQKATIALGRIEAKYAEAAATKAAAKPKITKAPAPPTERARGTNGAFVSVAGDTDDLDAFSAQFFAKRR